MGCVNNPYSLNYIGLKTRNLVAKEEGFREKAYKDTKGFLTIGYGFNLDAIGIPLTIADQWLDFLLDKVRKECLTRIKPFSGLNEARQGVLISMAYNMGIDGLLKFRDMIKALESKDYIAAAKAMEESRWYKDVPSRAKELISIMLTGNF